MSIEALPEAVPGVEVLDPSWKEAPRFQTLEVSKFVYLDIPSISTF